MKNLIIILFADKEHYGMFEVLSTISVMLLILAVVLYVFTRKHRREEVRTPLEDDGSGEAESNTNDFEKLDSDIESKNGN
jgi:Ca2+/Na+ antiporter